MARRFWAEEVSCSQPPSGPLLAKEEKKKTERDFSLPLQTAGGEVPPGWSRLYELPGADFTLPAFARHVKCGCGEAGMKSIRIIAGLAAILVAMGAASGQTQALAEKAQHAKELMAAGRAGEAVPIYRELLQSVPDNPGLMLNLGLALDLSGDKRGAIKQYEAVLKADPEAFPALLLMGTAYLDLGQPENAIGPLQKAAKLQPGNFQAQAVLAEAALDLDRFTEAAQSYLRLTAQAPSDAKLWYGLGVSYEGLAQKSFDALSDAAPGSAYWLDLVAESRLETKQTFAAFYFYRQALERMPTLRGAHAAIAEIYSQTGHADWAAKEQAKEAALPPPDCAIQKLECAFRAGDFEGILGASTTSPEALYWKTRACNRLALNAYSHLAKLPPSAEIYELQARINSKRRQYAEAAKELREALKLAPGNPNLKRELAIALYQSGSPQEAQKLFQELLPLNPESVSLNYFLGDALLNSQKPQEAIVYLEKAVDLRAQFLPAQKSLGLAYLQLGQAEKAIPHLRAALPADDDGSLHYQLGRAYQAHGERELARAMFKEYQETQQKNQQENKAIEKDVAITPP
jgi:tetratricopeptide (TPR) repeat protein